MDTYAASPEQLLRKELAKLTPQQRDKKVKEVGLERWKQAGAKVKPKTASSDRFMMFSSLPGERTTKDLKTLDKQYTLSQEPAWLADHGLGREGQRLRL